jgi:hypothetical protein
LQQQRALRYKKTTTAHLFWDNQKQGWHCRQINIWFGPNTAKEELNLYYPEIGEEQIFVTGTPQFECYQQPEKIIAKEVFYKVGRYP